MVLSSPMVRGERAQATVGGLGPNMSEGAVTQTLGDFGRAFLEGTPQEQIQQNQLDDWRIGVPRRRRNLTCGG